MLLELEMRNAGFDARYVDPHNTRRVLKITAIHREIGDIPGCRQPIYVESLCEQHGVAPDRPDKYGNVVDCYIQCLVDYNAGNYTGTYGSVSEYWNHVKNELGIRAVL